MQVGDIENFDSSGAVFLSEIKNVLNVENLNYQNCSKPLHDMLEFLAHSPENDPGAQDKAENKRNIAISVGQYTVSVLNQLYTNVEFTGEVICHLLKAIRRPQVVRWKDVWRAMEESGPNALPIIALLGFMIGLILSFQASIQLEKFGVAIYVVNIVGVGMAREMAPLFTSILLAGRTSSAFAAEIGTMKVNQEVDALQTLGLSSVRFLVLPRIIAVTLMLPLLSVFMLFFSLIGCGIFMLSLGYPWDIFMKQLFNAVSEGDLWGGDFQGIYFWHTGKQRRHFSRHTYSDNIDNINCHSKFF